MRLLPLSILLVLALGCSTTKNAAIKHNSLIGTWLPIKLEIAGKELPAETYSNQKLILSDSTYTFIAESVDKGVVRYEGNKMDIYGREGVNAGKHFTTIYKYENEQLTICYNLKGDSYPEAFETKTNPFFFLAVFKKENTK